MFAYKFSLMNVSHFFGVKVHTLHTIYYTLLYTLPIEDGF